MVKPFTPGISSLVDFNTDSVSLLVIHVVLHNSLTAFYIGICFISAYDPSWQDIYIQQCIFPQYFSLLGLNYSLHLYNISFNVFCIWLIWASFFPLVSLVKGLQIFFFSKTKFFHIVFLFFHSDLFLSHNLGSNLLFPKS